MYAVIFSLTPFGMHDSLRVAMPQMYLLNMI